MITARRAMKAAGKYASKAWLCMRMGLGDEGDMHCPACQSSVPGFFRYGDCADWGCPKCGASPRARLVNYLIDSGKLTLPQGGSILHMAPNEASLVTRFRDAASNYLPADIDPSRYPVDGVRCVDLMDIGEINEFDLFYASHVMEHVPDDALVLRNIYDALKPGGEAWLIVPLWDKPSEDGTPGMTGRERERRFGQWDHVRQYGPDFADRVRAVGFDVEVLKAEDLSGLGVVSMALGESLFRACKPKAGR